MIKNQKPIVKILSILYCLTLSSIAQEPYLRLQAGAGNLNTTGNPVKLKLVDNGDGTFSLAVSSSGGAFTGGLTDTQLRATPVPVTNASLPLPLGRASSSSDVHTPASNTAAVVTYAAAGGSTRHVVSGIAWSYSAAPTGGNLKIEDGSGTTVFSIDITSAGAGFFPFAVPKTGTANTAMIVTLSAGGSGVTGKVSVLDHWTQ